MNRPQAILFDMDGTLVDAFAPIVGALNGVLREFGKEELSAEAIRRFTGGGVDHMQMLFGERKIEALQRFHELHDARYLSEIAPLPGADALLRWLAEQQIPAAIVTSKGESRAHAQLAVLGWQSLFGAVVGKIDGRPEKPSPAPVWLACERLGVEASETLFIGDGLADMRAGAAAGSRPLGLIGHYSAEELSDAGADDCFASLNDLHRWLQATLSPRL